MYLCCGCESGRVYCGCESVRVLWVWEWLCVVSVCMHMHILCVLSGLVAAHACFLGLARRSGSAQWRQCDAPCPLPWRPRCARTKLPKNPNRSHLVDSCGVSGVRLWSRAQQRQVLTHSEGGRDEEGPPPPPASGPFSFFTTYPTHSTAATASGQRHTVHDYSRERQQASIIIIAGVIGIVVGRRFYVLLLPFPFSFYFYLHWHWYMLW